MVIEVKLEAHVSVQVRASRLQIYLDNIVAELEDDDVLHPEVLLDHVHAASSLLVLPAERMLAMQSLGHVRFKMSEKIKLGLLLIWEVGIVDDIVLSNRCHPRSAVGDVIDRPVRCAQSRTISKNDGHDSLLCRSKHHGRAIIEMDTDAAVGQGIPHSVLIAIIYPRDDEDLGEGDFISGH